MSLQKLNGQVPQPSKIKPAAVATKPKGPTPTVGTQLKPAPKPNTSIGGIPQGQPVKPAAATQTALQKEASEANKTGHDGWSQYTFGQEGRKYDANDKAQAKEGTDRAAKARDEFSFDGKTLSEHYKGMGLDDPAKHKEFMGKYNSMMGDLNSGKIDRDKFNSGMKDYITGFGKPAAAPAPQKADANPGTKKTEPAPAPGDKKTADPKAQPQKETPAKAADEKKPADGKVQPQAGTPGKEPSAATPAKSSPTTGGDKKPVDPRGPNYKPSEDVAKLGGQYDAFAKDNPSLAAQAQAGKADLQKFDAAQQQRAAQLKDLTAKATATKSGPELLKHLDALEQFRAQNYGNNKAIDAEKSAASKALGETQPGLQGLADLNHSKAYEKGSSVFEEERGINKSLAEMRKGIPAILDQGGLSKPDELRLRAHDLAAQEQNMRGGSTYAADGMHTLFTDQQAIMRDRDAQIAKASGNSAQLSDLATNVDSSLDMKQQLQQWGRDDTQKRHLDETIDDRNNPNRSAEEQAEIAKQRQFQDKAWQLRDDMSTYWQGELLRQSGDIRKAQQALPPAGTPASNPLLNPNTGRPLTIEEWLRSGFLK